MNLPITLIAYALSEKVVNQLKIYLYLKEKCSGHFLLNEQNIKHACEFLVLKSEKTFHKNLNWLIRNKWVAFNSKTNSCRIISFARLCHKLAIKTKTGVHFEIDDFKSFRPFLYAAIFAWTIRRKDWHERQPVRKKGRTNKSMSKPKCQMPNRYLAKILSLDHSTISRYKLAASTAGYISVQHRFEDTELPEMMLYSFQKYQPEDAHLLVIHQGTVQRQQPDEIKHSIHLKHYRTRSP